MAIVIIRKVGVETGGSNIQFAVNPDNGDIRIIEMNPRVSRSSALASKATGFPIAKIAAKLAVGYTLDEIPNDITQKTPASFEPTIDYVVAKIPKWDFEKFKEAEDVLGTQMKSVGEVMAIGRTFKEALFKGLRSLEAVKPLRLEDVSDDEVQRKLARPNSQRFSYITYALQHDWPISRNLSSLARRSLVSGTASGCDGNPERASKVSNSKIFRRSFCALSKKSRSPIAVSPI